MYKTIIEFPDYKINEWGEILAKDGSVLKQTLNPDGYFCVTLYDCGDKYYRRVGRLVAKTFIHNPDNLPVVDHVDGVRTNDHVSNLEWVTTLENNIRSIVKFPERHKNNTELTSRDVHEVCKLIEAGYNNRHIVDQTDVTIDAIKKIRSGTSWKEISKNYTLKPSKVGYTEEDVKFVCEKIKEGYTNRQVEELTNGDIKYSFVKSIRARRSHKELVDKYMA